MRVLALDTTTREGSVALVEDDRVIAEYGGDVARSHAERLPGDLVRALDSAGWASSSIDVFAIVAGPGSFTGLRIGIATLQGLALVHGRPVVAVSALEALAQIAGRGLGTGSLVAAWVDAHRHEVFSALYRVQACAAFSPDRIVEIEAPVVETPASLLARWDGLHQVGAFVGDGAELYAAMLDGAAGLVPAPRLAAAAGLMAVETARRGGAVEPAAVRPIYIRRPDAEVARARARDREAT
jgi:tRNA threonylcarbamoyladenosine biosynthesis protein TsaB